VADIHGSPGSAPQMPAREGAGPEPVPYSGTDLSPEPPVYSVPDVTFGAPGAEVLDGVTGNKVQESAYAHAVDAGVVTPYYGGAIGPIQVHGDADAGGRDIVSGTVAGAVAAREAFYLENQSEAIQPGPGTIGDLMTFPAAGEDPGAGAGNTNPTGAFYDPGRDYGGAQGAPGYQGDAQ
jgi:hypothetical protein